MWCVKSGIALGTTCTFLTNVSTHTSCFSREVYKCFRLADETVTVGLQINATGANVTADFNWVSKGSIGVEQESYGDESVYVPMFAMKKIRKPDERRSENNLTEERCVLFTTSNSIISQDETCIQVV